MDGENAFFVISFIVHNLVDTVDLICQVKHM